RSPFLGFLRGMHHAQYNYLGLIEIVEHDIGKSPDGPVAHPIFHRSATPRICDQIGDSLSNAGDKTVPKLRLPFVIPLRRTKDVSIKAGMIANKSSHFANRQSASRPPRA